MYLLINAQLGEFFLNVNTELLHQLHCCNHDCTVRPRKRSTNPPDNYIVCNNRNRLIHLESSLRKVRKMNDAHENLPRALQHFSVFEKIFQPSIRVVKSFGKLPKKGTKCKQGDKYSELDLWDSRRGKFRNLFVVFISQKIKWKPVKSLTRWKRNSFIAFFWLLHLFLPKTIKKQPANMTSYQSNLNFLELPFEQELGIDSYRAAECSPNPLDGSLRINSHVGPINSVFQISSQARDQLTPQTRPIHLPISTQSFKTYSARLPALLPILVCEIVHDEFNCKTKL